MPKTSSGIASVATAPLRASLAIYRTVVPRPVRMKLWLKRHEYGTRTAAARDSAHRTQRVQRILAASHADSGATDVDHLSCFERALAEHYRHSGPDHPMLETWVRYSWESNKRGQDAVNAISKHINVAGKWHLDIGSAYGGTSIAFAEAGAESWGVELEPHLLRLAQANLADHAAAKCTFIQGDILDPAVAAQVGKVDIITCENVIEHVASARGLLDVIRTLLTDDGIAHLWIPNAFSYTEVRRDGHYGLFGLTLLDREDAVAYHRAAGNPEEYGVGEYCFTLDDYTALFSSAGLRLELLNPMPAHRRSLTALQQDIESLPTDFAEACASQRIPTLFVPLIQQRLNTYMRGFRTAYDAYLVSSPAEQEALGARLLREYRVDTWYVVACPMVPTAYSGRDAHAG